MQPMSGSGDLHVMRVIRQLHVCVGELTYGSHMAVHMALGLLFLGGGRYVPSFPSKLHPIIILAPIGIAIYDIIINLLS